MRILLIIVYFALFALPTNCNRVPGTNDAKVDSSQKLPSTEIRKDEDQEDEEGPLSKFYLKEPQTNYEGYLISRIVDEKTNKISLKIEKNGKKLLAYGIDNKLPQFLEVALYQLLPKRTKQLIVMEYSGGAHCCWSFEIYDLLPTFRKIYDEGNYDVGYPLFPKDINHDGIPEIERTILTFDYFHASHASSVFPTAIFTYDRRRKKYTPANRQFSDYLLENIEHDIEAAQKTISLYEGKEVSEFEERYYQAIVQVVLKYIYAGQKEKGWDFFEKNYHASDKKNLRKDLQNALRKDAIYQSIY